ncbi:MAG: hypothetical protein PHS14_00100 [Elusimicrobia bacterium]|nr:hypothetical protein [Elusimicrobiota bacterium]
MNHAHFEVVKNEKDSMTIRDLGPWHQHLTITNDAEHVVTVMAPSLNGRRLFYEDSMGDVDELLVKNGQFDGFAAGPR